MLKGQALQFQVAGGARGLQGLVVAGVGLGVALLLHQDCSDLSQAGGNLAIVSQFAVDRQPPLGGLHRLVELAQGSVGVRQVAQRGGQVAACRLAGQLLKQRDGLLCWGQRQVGVVGIDRRCAPRLRYPSAI